MLRALCETSQKEHELEPGSFVGEIMRAIFTMAEPIERTSSRNDKHKLYDEANAHKGVCAEEYYLCKHSLWEADFVI